MDPARHEIIEVALVLFDADKILERYSSLVRPRGRLSLDIAALTGIHADELAAAPTFGEVAPKLRQFVAGRPTVGQSIWMDLAMLEGAGVVLPNARYDTYELATLFLPDLPSYTLSTIAARLQVSVASSAVPAHRALADAEVTAEVFRALLARIDRFDTPTLEQLDHYTRLAGWDSAALISEVVRDRRGGPLFARLNEEERIGSHELAFLTARDRPESLRRTGTARPIEATRLRGAFAAAGPLSDVIEGYERRPQQEEMAVAVADALSDDGHLLVEAGTGTGKSMAYLLPAALHAVDRGEPVVVSTNTLALQDQLYRKDLPDLRAALKNGTEPFVASVLKGRSNYLCLRRWFSLQRQPTVDPAEAGLRAKILIWLAETETGDRAELRLTLDEEVHWRGVAEDEGACVASRCIFQQRNQCFLYRARREAERAHLIIVNHALLLSDVMAGSRILPEYDRLIIDEAHHLEDQATTQFGITVDERAVVDHLESVVRSDGPIAGGALATAAAYLARAAIDDASQRRAKAAAERVSLALPHTEAGRNEANQLFSRLLELVARRDRDGGFDRTLRLTAGVRNDGAWLEIDLIWERLEQELRALDDELRWFVEAVERSEPAAESDDPTLAEVQHEEALIALGLAIRGGSELSTRLQAVIGGSDREQIYWIERSMLGDRASLHGAPLHVGDVLRDRLFGPLRSVVLTSATITTDGTFDFVAERLGLEDPTEKQVASPFDYQRSTLLYLVDDLPEPGQPGYQRRMQDVLIDLCSATRGRALVLFTSHAALQATAKAIKRPLESAGVLVLAQRLDGSPRQLIERLRTTPNTVVLGTATFWEGVDVVGPALSTLVITKLPFAVPSDPIFAARSELFDEPFHQYAVPQAVLRFKQGFGRLIRSSHDHGVCAVLDRRILTKRYGASFVQSLPECSVTVGSASDLPIDADNWLERGASAFEGHASSPYQTREPRRRRR
jgi:DNA polymerase-3 subunit epsilon/ATP-dependent DNA helicase DinG